LLVGLAQLSAIVGGRGDIQLDRRFDREMKQPFGAVFAADPG